MGQAAIPMPTPHTNGHGYTRLEGRLRKEGGGGTRSKGGAKSVSKLSCLAEGYLRATPSLARGTPWAVTSQGRFPPAVLTGPLGRPAQVRSSRTSFNLLHVRLQRTSHVSPAARRPCRPHSGGTRTMSGVFRRHGERGNGDDLPNAPEGAPSRLPPVAGEAGGRPVQA